MKSQISGTTQLIGIVANPIRHSISPKMHNAVSYTHLRAHET